jgi:3-oxoadipate enol-lactonase
MRTHVRLPSGLAEVRLDGPDEGPVLILAHSLAAHSGMWDGQISAWGKRFRVVRYDLPGHGGSAGPEGDYSLNQLGGDALALMGALGIGRAHWCGLSLGGMIGMWLLMHVPDRVDRAVLAHTSACLGPTDIWNGRIRTVARHGIERIVEPTLRLWFSGDFIQREPATVGAVGQMIRATSSAGFVGCCAAIRDMDLRSGLCRIDRLVLVMAGRHDRATSWADGAAIAEAIRESRLVTLETAHFGNIEQPRAFARAVEDFLD